MLGKLSVLLLAKIMINFFSMTLNTKKLFKTCENFRDTNLQT